MYRVGKTIGRSRHSLRTTAPVETRLRFHSARDCGHFPTQLLYGCMRTGRRSCFLRRRDECSGCFLFFAKQFTHCGNGLRRILSGSGRVHEGRQRLQRFDIFRGNQDPRPRRNQVKLLRDGPLIHAQQVLIQHRCIWLVLGAKSNGVSR